MTDSSAARNRGGLVIRVRPMDGGGWESSVSVAGKFQGGGTAPSVHGELDLAMDILYGDTNDHLNGDEGAIRVLES